MGAAHSIPVPHTNHDAAPAGVVNAFASSEHLPARNQWTVLAALVIGLPGSVALSFATATMSMSATGFHGPEWWTILAAGWAGFFVVEGALAAGSLAE